MSGMEVVSSASVEGSRLKGLLKDLGWTQQVLADRISVTLRSVNAWCTGRTRVPAVVLLYLEFLIKYRREGSAG